LKNTVFYSWTSVLPNSTNRSFIEKSLSKAIKQLKSQVDLLPDIALDRDTINTSGSPDISHTIFDKISNAVAFVGDISIINQPSKDGRPMPNPNVLVELGYAAAQLGWDSIICIFNLEYGQIEDLPFDIRNRRILTYRVKPNEKNKTLQQNELVKKLVDAIKAIIIRRGQNNVKSLLNVDILMCSLHIEHESYEKYWWKTSILLFVTSQNEGQKIRFIKHKCKVLLEIPNIVNLTKFSRLYFPKHKNSFQFVIDGSDAISIEGDTAETPKISINDEINPIITIELVASKTEFSKIVTVELPRSISISRGKNFWEIKKIE
jgi:sporulation protein YlmC with PRC-barrel domain